MSNQRVLVYSPDVRAYIYSRRLGSAIDVSRDIVRGSVNRVIDSASTFSFTLRNEKSQYTGILSRNDRIVIWLKKTDWIQVFSGYLDVVPLIDMFPSDAEIKGTCTIKRLRDFFWDPGLAENNMLMNATGEGATSPDGGASQILTNLVGKVGGFSISPEDHLRNKLWIQEIPTNYVDFAARTLSGLSDPGEVETEILKYLGGGSKVLKGGGAASGGVSGGSGSAAKILQIARGEIGTREEGGLTDRQKYGAAFGWNGVFWCAQFVWWCGREAGLSEAVIPKTAAVAVFRKKFEAEGRIVTDPKPGDLFMVMPDQHIGFVEEVISPTQFRTIEGNTGDGSVASTVYTRTPNIIFGRPNYPNTETVNAAESGDLKSLLRAAGFEGDDLNIAMGIAWATSDLDAAWANTAQKRAGLFGLPYGNAEQRQAAKSPTYSAQAAWNAITYSPETPDKWARFPAYNDGSYLQHVSKNGKIRNLPGEPSGASAIVDSVTGDVQKWSKAPVEETAKTIPFGGTKGCLTPNNRHAGIDYEVPSGTSVRAVASGKVVYANRSDAWGLRIVVAHPGGYFSVYAHLRNSLVGEGKQVSQNDVVGVAGDKGVVHFEVWDRFEPNRTGHELNPSDFLNKQNSLPTVGGGDAVSTGSEGGLSIEDVRNQAALQIFNALYRPFEKQGLSVQLTGERARMNDESLLESVKTYVKAGMRRFMSSPTGDFLAFFPDYFGEHGTAPSLKIADVELIDAKVKLNHNEYTSHVFSVIATNPGSISPWDKLYTNGVVTLEQGSTWENLVPNHPEGYTDPAEMMRVLGIRPAVKEYDKVQNEVFGWFLAARDFQDKWARQFDTSVQFTFMPELYPGMRVEFGEHKVEVFIESVTHTFDFKSGFKTTATITCPVIREGSPIIKRTPMSYEDRRN